MKIDMQQYSASVADFDFFFVIFSVFYENVDTSHNPMCYTLECHENKISNSLLPVLLISTSFS